ncbi:MAG TPA: murein biosynthesis integral membrane protein MurJ, partial [Actinomycetota bacterium]|nr:murein biosynthesis integral membrane protein MurJ [Actinomycetota bacterium]
MEEGAVGADVTPDEDLHPEGAGLVRSTALMSIGTALSRLTGFLRVSSMAFALGVAETRLADAYNVPNNIPNIVYELVLGGILTSVFVPVFVQELARKDEHDPWHVARAVMTVTLVVLGLVMLVGIVFAPAVVRLYTFRVPAEAREASQELAAFLLRFFMPQIVLYGLGAVATGVLNAHRRFAIPMFAPILNNLVVIASFLTFAFMPGPAGGAGPGGITTAQKLVLALGATGGVAVMTFVLWPSLRRLGFRWRWTFDLRHPAVRKLVRLSGWVAGYVVVNQLGLLVVIVLAGGVQGGYTAYQSAFIFFQLPHAIFAVSIMTALLPSLSELWVRRDAAGFRSVLARGVRASAFIVVPAAAGYLVLATPIVRLLLEHGVAGTASTDLVSGVLTFFAIGLFPFSAFQLLLRAFYAMQDTRTPLLINVAAVALNTVINLALFPVLDVRGLALGHAAAYTFAVIVAGVILRRRLGGLEGRTLSTGLARVGAAAAVTAAA